jgi:hypothetical protein
MVEVAFATIRMDCRVNLVVEAADDDVSWAAVNFVVVAVVVVVGVDVASIAMIHLMSLLNTLNFH